MQPEGTFVEGTRTAMSKDMHHGVAIVGAPHSPRPPWRNSLYLLQGMSLQVTPLTLRLGQDSGIGVRREESMTLNSVTLGAARTDALSGQLQSRDYSDCDDLGLS